MKDTDKRGRLRRFQGDERVRFATLIRQYGIRGAKRVSDSPVTVSTLIRIAREFGIVLKKGKRPKSLESYHRTASGPSIG